MAEVKRNARFQLELGGIVAKGMVTAFKKGGVIAADPMIAPDGDTSFGESINTSEITIDLFDMPTQEHDILRNVRGQDGILRALSTNQAWSLPGLSCTDQGSSDGQGKITMTFVGSPAKPL